MQPLLEMRRRADEHGVSGEVRWSILRTGPGVMPEGRIQFVYPHTPELSWPVGSFEHPNAADVLTGVLICAEDKAEATRRFAQFLGQDGGDAGQFNCDRGALLIASPEEAEAHIPNFGLDFVLLYQH